MGLTTAELIRFRTVPLKTEFLSHTQPVEREIALMTRTAKEVVGETRQAAQQIGTGIFRSAHPSRKRKQKMKRAAAAVATAKKRKNRFRFYKPRGCSNQRSGLKVLL